jgi:molybdopterin-binding protein
MDRVADAAALLGVSDDTVRRWIDGRQVPVRRQANGPPPGTTRSSSARNRPTGIVTRVVCDMVMTQVEIQAGPFRFVSLMSREAADELSLEIGARAVATLKATQVSVDVP